VSDIDRSVPFYRDILGYDTLIYDKTGIFGDLQALPAGEEHYRRVLLGCSRVRDGAFLRLLGASTIELLQSLDRTPNKILKDRFWGDLGYIQICYDIQGMASLKALCAEKGFPFTVESNPRLQAVIHSLTWVRRPVSFHTRRTPTARLSSSSRPTGCRF
jgi:hypothetical protein